MIAITSTNTAYHPRGSGPAYGVQFERIRAAWYRMRSQSLAGHQPQTIHWVFSGDVEVEMWLWCEVDKEPYCVGVYHADKITDEFICDGEEIELGLDAEGRGECITCIGTVTSCDELIRTWWEKLGQYNMHPWDPNGIVEARRLGLKRSQEPPEWGEDEWNNMHETDRLTFEAYDRGDFALKTKEEVWNSVNQVGLRWDTN